MLFWRTKSAKPASTTESIDATPADGATAAAEPVATSDTSANSAVVEASIVDDAIETAAVSEPKAETQPETPQHDSKIITLSSVRLADRLADLNGKDRDGATGSEPAILSPGDARTFGEAVTSMQGQAALRRALESSGTAAHFLIIGPAGSGRREAALSAAKHIAALRQPLDDLIYTASSASPATLTPYRVPHGTGAHIVRDIHDALAKSTAMLSRLIASDTHQMSVAVLEEDHRQRSDGGLELLRRRAEAQNIALVRTSEGFVLAPMHEGRVVRSDVFRALPEKLQRDVESKIATLEGELQQVLSALGDADIATDDRHLALSQQTAERAIKPNLSMARKLFANGDAVSKVFEAIESDWTRRATDAVRRGRVDEMLASPGLHAVSADAGEGAPVIVAHAVSASDLLGEVGRDANGAIAIRPGLLTRAAGGVLIVEAWRLAADPTGWPALSAAIETGSVQPISAPGLAVAAEPVPLTANILLIAERRSLARLRRIDPRFENYFSDTVAFEANQKNITPIGMAL